MRRLTSGAVLAAITTISSLAAAESQAELAAKLNEDGKELMFANKYAEASAKFREAVARVPEAKYFFNLCTSLFQEGKFSEAITACNAVEKNNPTPELNAKASKLSGRINDEAKSQGLTVTAAGGGGIPDCNQNPGAAGCAPPPETCQTNPGAPECQPQQPPPMMNPVVGRPPSGTGVFAGTKAGDNKYIWTVGGNFFGGGGTIGQEGFYGNTAVGFELHGNYLFNPAQRIGTQVYIQYAQFAPGEDQSGNELNLSAVDLGIGLYKHICPPGTERLCLTPMIGAQLALYSPEFDQFDNEAQFNYAAVGVRAELGLEYAFGSRMEHVLSVKIGANGYSGVFSDPGLDGGLTAEMAGLDKGGGYGYFGIGYTHRFSTPLGSSPFVTLE
jgi:tetratricopeptide (TPR) repeat protein